MISEILALFPRKQPALSWSSFIAVLKKMNPHQEHLVHARALRAEILAAPGLWLPRREVLLEWLDGFLQRVAVANYELGETEATDLVALDSFLRKRSVPAI